MKRVLNWLWVIPVVVAVGAVWLNWDFLSYMAGFGDCPVVVVLDDLSTPAGYDYVIKDKRSITLPPATTMRARVKSKDDPSMPFHELFNLTDLEEIGVNYYFNAEGCSWSRQHCFSAAETATFMTPHEGNFEFTLQLQWQQELRGNNTIYLRADVEIDS